MPPRPLVWWYSASILGYLRVDGMRYDIALVIQVAPLSFSDD
jgi:hypothetical protein